MNNTSDIHSSYFYKLAMSIGISFDLQDNCKQFCDALLLNPDLLGVSIWRSNDTKGSTVPTQGNFYLLYCAPEKNITTGKFHDGYLTRRIIKDTGYCCLRLSDERYEEVVIENIHDVFSVCIYSLLNFGVIKLFYRKFETSYINKASSNMAEIITKFALSLQNSISYSEMQEKADRNDLLASAVNQSADILSVVKVNGLVEYVNKSFETVYGYHQSETIGQPLGKFIKHPPLLRAYLKILRAVTAGKNWHGIVEAVVKDGSIRKFEITVAPVFAKNGAISKYVMAQRDVTKRVLLEDSLRQSQKMESLGTLAGGIAHDFNNILFSVMGNLELAMDSFDNLDALKRSIIDAYASSSRAQGLVKQIMAFSRKEKLDAKVISLKKAIVDVEKMIKASIPSRVTIHSSIEKEGCILADPSQFNQILVNLCTNSYKAIEGNGSIVLRTRGVNTLELKKILRSDKTKIDWICVEVVDNGIGIPEEIINKIFDPFFTTREVGKGTGLGLSMVHGIIDRMNGEIFVESKVGVGTVFSLFLPLCDKSELNEPLIEGMEKNSLKQNTSYRILIVDDELMVGSLYERGLKKLGHTVDFFDKPLEALKYFMEDPSKFDLVITDMMMPKMTGDVLVKKIRSIRSDMPIIVCSGYSEDAEREDLLTDENYLFMEKPIIIQRLAKNIAKLCGKFLD